ncbi:MAG: DUF1080 domain-containing protein [Alphaproteobacteria bacterium]|nr:DUF1080 domain-containing protein [Alphaproteobacteria bacterium]
MKSKLLLLLLLITLVNKNQAQNNMDSLAKEAAKSEQWQPVPPVVTPGKTCGAPPSDAIILFDGKNLDNFEKKDKSKAAWTLNNDGTMTVVKGSGDIQSKEKFGSCQLHLEFKMPSDIAGSGQSRGNSGIYFMKRYELQLLDNFNNSTYSNGQVGSVYKQHIPLANPSKPPGEWQYYDIIFMRPIFSDNGIVLRPATITVFLNGILIQNNVTIYGNTVWVGAPQYEKHADKLPILLQDHGFDGGNPISFANIWVRPLEN